MYSKTELRKIALEIRSNLDNDFVSSKIVKNILSWSEFEFAKNIMIFYPIKSEVDLLPLLSVQNKSFYFPKIIGDDIVPVLYKNELGFINGKFNILEPLGTILDDFTLLDLVFLPALAIDCSGYRLGYGKGFYDRFVKLIDKSVTTTCVPISKSLIFNNLPIETHDEKFDYVVTEDSVFTLSNLVCLSP